MENFILVVHVLLALGIVGLIMLQQGKGAEMGASFGSGASQTVFGAAGSGNFFSRLTAIMAAVFFATSFGLAVVAKKSSSIDESMLPTAEPAAAMETTEKPAEIDASAVDALEGAATTATQAKDSAENAVKALESE